jgi:hypothetical protein
MYKYFGVYKKGRFQMFRMNIKTGEILCVEIKKWK